MLHRSTGTTSAKIFKYNAVDDGYTVRGAKGNKGDGCVSEVHTKNSNTIRGVGCSAAEVGEGQL